MTTSESTRPTQAQLTPESRLTISASVYARAFGSELVLLDFGCGEYYGLDEVGTEIWRALEAGQALGQVADAIVGRYEVPREEALRDILALVSQLQAQGLLAVAQPDV